MTWVILHQKGSTNLDLNDTKDDGGGTGISWTICKLFAPHFGQVMTPASYHLIFLQAGYSSSCPTNNVKELKAINCEQVVFNIPLDTYSTAIIATVRAKCQVEPTQRWPS